MPATSVVGAFFSACSWAWPNSVAAKANGAIERRPRNVMEIILSLNGNYHVRRFRRRAAEVILAAGVNLRWGASRFAPTGSEHSQECGKHVPRLPRLYRGCAAVLRLHPANRCDIRLGTSE